MTFTQLSESLMCQSSIPSSSLWTELGGGDIINNNTTVFMLLLLVYTLSSLTPFFCILLVHNLMFFFYFCSFSRVSPMSYNFGRILIFCSLCILFGFSLPFAKAVESNNLQFLISIFSSFFHFLVRLLVLLLVLILAFSSPPFRLPSSCILSVLLFLIPVRLPSLCSCLHFSSFFFLTFFLSSTGPSFRPHSRFSSPLFFSSFFLTSSQHSSCLLLILLLIFFSSFFLSSSSPSSRSRFYSPISSLFRPPYCPSSPPSFRLLSRPSYHSFYP
jgi:hypothetical protein